MKFEILKIRNGWNITGIWIEPGGGDVPPQPMTETLYCKEISQIANVLIAWADGGFNAAFACLQDILNQKEAH